MRKEDRYTRAARKAKIRNGVIGAVVISLTVGGWGTYTMYRNRHMTEMMMEAVKQENERTSDSENGYGAEHGESGNAVADVGRSERGSADDSTALAWDGTGDVPIAPGQKEEQTADPRDLNLMPVLADNLVKYHGKTYRRNQYIKSILCMGVDRSDTMTDSKDLGAAGQSDGIFLIAQDTARHSLKILMIPRDTMTEIPITNEERTLQDTKITQLTMAYAYGDGREQSCENTVQSVSKLLSGFSIDQYLAVDTTVVARLNDAVGGVTVTIPTDGMEKKDPAFVKGEQVTLHGSQAEAFVRYRDITRDFSALYRMDQQQEYITQYFKAVKAAARTDSQIVTHLFDLIQDYMVTDMSKAQYLKIAMDGLEAGSLTSADFYTVPGSGETTETYDVYRADRQAVIPIILNLFYREDGQ